MTEMRDERLVKKLVGEAVEQVHASETISNPAFKKILPLLIEKGIDNVNLTMFNDELKKQLLGFPQVWILPPA